MRSVVSIMTYRPHLTVFLSLTKKFLAVALKSFLKISHGIKLRPCVVVAESPLTREGLDGDTFLHGLWIGYYYRWFAVHLTGLRADVGALSASVVSCNKLPGFHSPPSLSP